MLSRSVPHFLFWADSDQVSLGEMKLNLGQISEDAEQKGSCGTLLQNPRPNLGPEHLFDCPARTGLVEPYTSTAQFEEASAP